MYNIVCIKWGKLYSSDYVNILYSMVKRNVTLPFRFVCLTDDTTGIDSNIECFPILDPTLKGVWHKVSLFRKDLYDLSGEMLFLDLDTIIVDNIDPILKFKGNFITAINWHSRPGRNSAMMKFEIGKHVDIWEDFIRQVDSITQGKLKGDQNWVTKKRPNETLWPEEWCPSYKIHCLGDKKEASIPEGAKVILFHGKPDPHEISGSIKEFWN